MEYAGGATAARPNPPRGARRSRQPLETSGTCIGLAMVKAQLGGPMARLAEKSASLSACSVFKHPWNDAIFSSLRQSVTVA